ncbi:hypothetical protein CP03DC29_0067A, partial [Chlamydia psittaci 03DC29]
MFFFDLVQ